MLGAGCEGRSLVTVGAVGPFATLIQDLANGSGGDNKGDPVSYFIVSGGSRPISGTASGDGRDGIKGGAGCRSHRSHAASGEGPSLIPSKLGGVELVTVAGEGPGLALVRHLTERGSGDSHADHVALLIGHVSS